MRRESERAMVEVGYRGDEARYEAIMRRDREADGVFVFAVRTTGIYCRPSCAARRPLRKNVAFYATAADAERAGYRPCKRCLPRDATQHPGHVAHVEQACRLIVEAESPPSLEALAEAVGLSPSYFHHVFKTQTGLTPKEYGHAQRTERVRDALSGDASVTAAIYQAGYNSNGRFYAESATVLGMTPSAFKAGGAGVRIRFAVGECELGSILVAATDWGICAISLEDDPETLVQELQDRFDEAELVGGDSAFEQIVAEVVAFVENPRLGLDLPLHVQGTAFQHRVWKALCEIPCGETRSYASVANAIGQTNAARAVARACGANELAVAIPCHRVVRQDESRSGYRWGVERKERLLEGESR